VTDKTARLIEHLVADATPVHRLRPPVVRAGLWLVAVAAIATVAIVAFADMDMFHRRFSDWASAVELAATCVTGIAAVLAAFELSLPDRSSAWALLPLPALGIWIASSGYACYRNWVLSGPTGWELGESANCLIFILATSIPLAAGLLIVLRRAKTLTPIRVTVVGALGVSALAAAALQFFHPFDVTLIDLGVHLLAVTIVVLTMTAAERLMTPRNARLS
jgi:hypothetical protein